jgi:hypothetical protein
LALRESFIFLINKEDKVKHKTICLDESPLGVILEGALLLMDVVQSCCFVLGGL